MKEIRENIDLYLTLLAIIIMIILFGSIPAKANGKENVLYPATMIVTEIDYDTDTVICVEANGNEWSFQGIEDYTKGDLIGMIMDDNRTPDYIYDDLITETRYVGYTKAFNNLIR